MFNRIYSLMKIQKMQEEVNQFLLSWGFETFSVDRSGIKAGIIGGIIIGVVFPIVITFFGAVLGLSGDPFPTTMYLALVIQFIILGVVGGLIFGVIYAVVYESLLGDYSIVKGFIL